jgi:hypothetical protein
MSLRACVLALLALASIAAFACESSTTEPEGCGEHATDCGGACVDLDVDVANCGKCGVACSGAQICGSGKCVAKPVLDAATDAPTD